MSPISQPLKPGDCPTHRTKADPNCVSCLTAQVNDLSAELVRMDYGLSKMDVIGLTREEWEEILYFWSTEDGVLQPNALGDKIQGIIDSLPKPAIPDKVRASVWVDETGQSTPICRLDDVHLSNIIRGLWRNRGAKGRTWSNLTQEYRSRSGLNWDALITPRDRASRSRACRPHGSSLDGLDELDDDVGFLSDEDRY